MRNDKKPEYMRELSTAPFYAVPINARVNPLMRFILKNMPKNTMELARYLPTMPMVRLGGKLGVPLPPTPSLSLGGLRVDLEQRVLSKGEFVPIHGLYAAGRTAAGVATGGYVSGMSIGDAIYSGRHAGRHAAQRAFAKEIQSDLPTAIMPAKTERSHLHPVAVSKL